MLDRLRLRGDVLAGLVFAAIVVATVPVAMAAGGGGSSDIDTSTQTRTDPSYTEGEKAIDAMDWRRAIDLFSKVVARDPKNANAFNWLGFAYRKSGDFDAAFKNYDRALAIDPEHRGAHEYVGEAYLQTGNLAKAEEHLKVLDRLCFFGCKEYTELKEKIAAYRAGKSS